MVIRLNDLHSVEISVMDGMIMSAAGRGEHDTWPIKKLLKQFFEQTLLRWLRTRSHRWTATDPNFEIYSSVMEARRVAQEQLLRF